MLSRLTDRSTGQEDKRRLILDAAVRVFARKGFHTCRVGDIAEEAGVAHGLLYHYFASKDELLETVFRETWSELLAAIHEVELSDAPAREPCARWRRSCSARGAASPTSSASSFGRSRAAQRCRSASTRS